MNVIMRHWEMNLESPSQPIFTDEPQMKGSMVFYNGDCEEDITLSFTDDLGDTYKEKYGVNLLEVVPELLWELPGGNLWSVQCTPFAVS